jgi:hypothetical protein
MPQTKVWNAPDGRVLIFTKDRRHGAKYATAPT